MDLRGPDVLCNALNISQIPRYSVGGPTRFAKIAVEILQSVNNRTQSLREILRMVIIDTVIINTLLGKLTLDPAGMRCPAWDDAFVSVFFLPAGQKSGFSPRRGDSLHRFTSNYIVLHVKLFHTMNCNH